MDSLLVTCDRRIVLEAAYAPFRAGFKHRINSATKSVVSTLVAMAMRDGRLDSTDRRLMEFFADRTIANLDDAKKAITIRHLLDMTSGLEWSDRGLDGFRSFLEMERSPDWQQFVLDRPMSEAPGTRFYYDSGNSHLLSAILTKITGKSAFDYAREELFGPLGIEDVMWRGDPQGISGGGAGLYMHQRDMAKIGYLYLRGGVWEGKQILPASWIEGVRKADVDMRETWGEGSLALRQPVLGDAGPGRLHGGRLRPSADRCHPQARHRGGDDRLGMFAARRAACRAGRATASIYRSASPLPPSPAMRRCPPIPRRRPSSRKR